ncbi:Fic family protein [Kingella kingae]
MFHSIINNHPFHNGNKRTALLSTIYYLGEL